MTDYNNMKVHKDSFVKPSFEEQERIVLNEIQGKLIEFPLNFLKDVDLKKAPACTQEGIAGILIPKMFT